MKAQADQLYIIFEQHLLNALVEDEGTEDFLNRVVQDYIRNLGEHAIIPQDLRKTVEDDLRDEVREMLRKKTYGHFSLKEFRQAQKNQAALPGKVAKDDVAAAKRKTATANAVAVISSRLKMRRPRRSN